MLAPVILTCVHTRTRGRASVLARRHSLLTPHHPWAAQIPETPGEGDKGSGNLQPCPFFVPHFTGLPLSTFSSAGAPASVAVISSLPTTSIGLGSTQGRMVTWSPLSLGSFCSAYSWLPPGSASAQPLVLASSVPARLVEKIKSGKYIDMEPEGDVI